MFDRDQLSSIADAANKRKKIKAAAEENEREARRRAARKSVVEETIVRAVKAIDDGMIVAASDGSYHFDYNFGEGEVYPEVRDSLNGRYANFEPEWLSVTELAVVCYETDTDREYTATVFRVKWPRAETNE